MEVIAKANNYIDQLYEVFINCENMSKIFNIVKYDGNLGIYLRYKCNLSDGFIITKIPYPCNDGFNVQLCIVAVDECKNPKACLTKYVELPNDDNIDNVTNRIKEYLLENSSFCEVYGT